MTCNIILGGTSKFQQIGPADTYDHAVKVEMQIPKRLSIHKSNFISKETYNRIRPVGCQCPQLYGQYRKFIK